MLNEFACHPRIKTMVISVSFQFSICATEASTKNYFEFFVQQFLDFFGPFTGGILHSFCGDIHPWFFIILKLFVFMSVHEEAVTSSIRGAFYLCMRAHLIMQWPWSAGVGWEMWHVMALGPGRHDVFLVQATMFYCIDNWVDFRGNCGRSVLAAGAVWVLNNTFRFGI